MTIIYNVRGQTPNTNRQSNVDRKVAGVVETVTIYYPVQVVPAAIAANNLGASTATAAKQAATEEANSALSRPANKAALVTPAEDSTIMSPPERANTPHAESVVEPVPELRQTESPPPEAVEHLEKTATLDPTPTESSPDPPPPTEPLTTAPPEPPTASPPTEPLDQTTTPIITLSSQSAPANLTSPVSDAIEPGKLSSGDAVELNNAAVKLMIGSDYEQAASLLQRAIEKDPDMYKFHRNLSIVYEKMNKYDDALVAARRADELAPNQPSVLGQLCGLHLLAGNNSDAITCYEKLLKFSPKDGLSLTYYAVALLRFGKVSKAVPILKNVSVTHPTAAVFNALGIGHMEQKQYRDAVLAFKNAVEADPDRHQLRFNLAVAQLASGNKEGAISQYRLLKEGAPKLAAKLLRFLSKDKVIAAPTR